MSSDPYTLAFEIPRPWPQRESGRWHWPPIIDIWHIDPTGDHGPPCAAGPHWRWHIHHWRVRIVPLIHLRRRLLTRCAWCGDRGTKTDPVNHVNMEPRKTRWWQGEPGHFHADCIAIDTAHSTCLCREPDLDYGDHGQCRICRRSRSFGATEEYLRRARELAAVPHGQRRRS